MLSLPPSMRLILWCPYVHTFIGSTVQSKLLGQIGSAKYSWIQRVIIANPGQVYVYCDTDMSSSGINHRDVLTDVTDRTTRQELCLKEAMMWAQINDLPLSRNNFLTDPQSVNPGDVLFCFSSHLLTKQLHELAPSSELACIFSRKDIFKVVHLSHYIFNLEILIRNLRTLGIGMLCYESNLVKSRLFQRHAPQIREVVTIPFAVEDRFRIQGAATIRDQRCVATGAMDHFQLNPSLKEFFFEYSTNSFNPMRQLLYENREMLANHLVIYMSKFVDNLKETQRYHIDLRSWRAALDGSSIELKQLKREPSYYSTSFVDLFNSHQLSYVSEEITHAPALAFFESMACGAIPIGIDNFIYRDIGLHPGEHYLPFDGSLGGLLAMIEVAWRNNQILEHMRSANLEFVTQHLRPDKVAERFLRELFSRYHAWTQHGQIAIQN